MEKKQKIFAVIMIIVSAALLSCNVLTYITIKEVYGNTKKNKTNEVITQVIETEPETWDKTEESEKEDVVSKEVIKSYFGEKGEGTLSLLRDTFTDSVVFYDGNYRFVDINPTLEKNELDLKGFGRDEKNFMTYKENGEITSHKGIDVSVYQGDIDWKKVAADGIEYAIIRVGYRGYGTGKLVEDDKARQNLQRANDVGIKIGVYFFTQAISEKEAVEEAEFVHEIIKDYKIDYPVVFDTEAISGDTARTDELTASERTDVTVAFCEKIQELGYTPMVYANIKWFTTALEMERLEKYDKWFAYYDSELYFPYKINMWQYSDEGNVDGISGKVDMNISFVEY